MSSPLSSSEAFFELLARQLPVQRRVLRAREPVYRSGESFRRLHVIHSGCSKVINRTDDGREQVVALHFKGDWLGFEGIADGRHGCDVVAMDVGEVWAIGYDALLNACAVHAPLMSVLHAAMSREIAGDHDLLMSLAPCPPMRESPNSFVAGLTPWRAASCAPTSSRCA